MTLVANGMVVSAKFPEADYERVHSKISNARNPGAALEHFSGAWNAIAYRFCALENYGQQLKGSFKQFGPPPNPIERFNQETALFGFFSSGFSVFEALYYGLYAVGSIAAPQTFPLATPRDQHQISIIKTIKCFQVVFPGSRFVTSLKNLNESQPFKDFRETRNILSRRQAPGRHFYISCDDDAATGWKLNSIPLDETLSDRGIKIVSEVLAKVLSDSATFVEQHFA